MTAHDDTPPQAAPGSATNTPSAADLAERFGLTLRGDGTVRIRAVATLANAGDGDVAFLANPRYRPQLAQSAASVVVLREEDADQRIGTSLIAHDPYVAFARIAALFDPQVPATPGIHASAVVDPTARVHASAQIDPFVAIGARTRIGAGCVIGPGCVIGDDCDIGDGTRLVARVTLVRRVFLGQRVLIHPGAVLGADGFGLAMDHDASGTRHWIKVPQQGGVRIGDDCEIGANTTIDRGAIEDTVLEEDVRLDNQIQVGHNVRIGAHTAIAGAAAVAGSTTIGRYCLIGGGAGLVGHIQLCDRVTITARSLVTSSIRQPGEYSSGTPLMPNREWRRNAVRFKQLDRLARFIGAQDKED